MQLLLLILSVICIKTHCERILLNNVYCATVVIDTELINNGVINNDSTIKINNLINVLEYINNKPCFERFCILYFNANCTMNGKIIRIRDVLLIKSDCTAKFVFGTLYILKEKCNFFYCWFFIYGNNIPKLQNTLDDFLTKNTKYKELSETKNQSTDVTSDQQEKNDQLAVTTLEAKQVFDVFIAEWTKCCMPAKQPEDTAIEKK